MNQAAHAYSSVAKTGLSPRENEASVLITAAARLQAVADNWETRRGELDSALSYNRRIWTVLAAAVTDEASPQPLALRQGVFNLAVFVFKRTFELLSQPSREKLTVLISINREIAAGLRASASASTSKAA